MLEVELASLVAEKLDMPNGKDVTYEIGEEFYLETAGLYCRNVDFYENGKLVASATVDSSDGELVRNIFRYENVE